MAHSSAMGTSLSQQTIKRSGSIGLAPTGDLSRPGTGMWRVFQSSRHLGCAHSLTFAFFLRSTQAVADVELMLTEILSPNLSFLQRASERFGDMTVPKCHGTWSCIAKTKPKDATLGSPSPEIDLVTSVTQGETKTELRHQCSVAEPRDGLCGMRRMVCGHGGLSLAPKAPE